MNEYIELLLGVILLFLGIVAIYFWRNDVLIMIKGIVGPIVLLIGILFTWIGFADIKEK